jgi:hypothetical protein
VGEFLTDHGRQFVRQAGGALFKRLRRLSGFTGHGEDGRDCGELAQGNCDPSHNLGCRARPYPGCRMDDRVGRGIPLALLLFGIDVGSHRGLA